MGGGSNALRERASTTSLYARQNWAAAMHTEKTEDEIVVTLAQ